VSRGSAAGTGVGAGAAPPVPERATWEGGYALKRLFLGRPIATARLEHERLGKPTALAVFASDNLSSTAYATEEILRVLVPVVGVAAFSLVVPISLVIVLVEAILIFSYRQTIKAYPTAGGAYIVTKDNFGLLPAQVAGVALLLDYVLTVAVSVAAGVQALSSVAPVLHAYRVPISLVFVWLIAYGNLLGVRESGKIFGIPTYLFVVSLLTTLGVGLYRVLVGHLEPAAVTQPEATLPLGAAAVSVFVVLRAFASGGAAVTGVEAISNGVPAFRKPEWHNARITLGWMGAILGTGFLGISFLAHRLQVLPVADESKSVLAQIADAVYGSRPVGHALFLVLQASTMLILVLAANTSFADFPRLASFHAGDSFLPRQFTRRGHRLVFSTGIIALAAAASVVLVAFNASVTNLIPLYALGVFTSFTLSQAGMARRHLRLREPGWRFGLLVNGIGAIATAIVDVVIAVVKFAQGAWMVMVAVPVMVMILVRVNRTYEREEEELLDGLSRIQRTPPRHHVALVVVEAIDEKTIHALQYALTIRPAELRAVHFVTDGAVAATLETEWSERGLAIPLTMIPCPDGDQRSCMARYVRHRAAEDVEVTLVVPGPARVAFWRRIRRGQSWAGLAQAVRELDNVLLVVVREHGGPGHIQEGGRLRVAPRAAHIVLIPVDRLDHSVVRAIRYARAIGPSEIRGLHAGVDPIHADHLIRQWAEFGSELAVPLEMVHCPDRNIPRAVKESIDELRGGDVEITVVMPRREYPNMFQRLLHDRTSRAIARGLEHEPHVDVVVVPYRLGRRVLPAASPEAPEVSPAR
jgi:amino acid transporter